MIRGEVVKTDAIGKSNSREALPSSFKDGRFNKTSGEQDSESKSREASEPSERGTRIESCENLPMAAILTTST